MIPGSITTHSLTRFLKTQLISPLSVSSSIFSPICPGFCLGARQTTFLPVDRLTFLQRFVDSRHFEADVQNRFGQHFFIGSPTSISRPDFAAELFRASGNADAQFALGIMNLGGIGMGQNLDHAFRYLRAASGRGHTRALYSYGMLLMLYMGVLGSKTYRKEMNSALRAAAEAGYTEALYAYGRLLLTENDDKMAFAMLQKAAQTGHRESTFWQGVCYRDGRGVKKDVEKAMELFEKALLGGSAEAATALDRLRKRTRDAKKIRNS
jgi:TPR repeat protein